MRFACTIAIVGTLSASGIAGQVTLTLSQPDVAPFVGTWVLDAGRSGLTETTTERRIITSEPTAMLMEIHRSEDASPITLVYRFDGSPTVKQFGSGTTESRLMREDAGLMLQTVFTINNQPITVNELLPPAPSGGEMHIALTLRVEHGYQGVAPAAGRTPPNASKATRVYTRQP
jgi:hypothetical protein